jgi:hypothetical protein
MRAATVVCCLILSSIGCRTIVPLASPVEDLSRLKPRTLLLTDADHSVVRMTDARLTGDTVVGTVKGQFTAIPLSRLTAVRALVASPKRTAELAVVGGAVVLALLLTHPWNHDGTCFGVEREGPNGEDLGGCCLPC